MTILSSNIVLADPVLSSGNESTAVTSEAAVPISAKVDTSPTDQELEKAILLLRRKLQFKGIFRILITIVLEIPIKTLLGT